LIVVMLAPSTAAAQARLTLVPSASVSSVYDDNLFAKAIGSADQMTLITPGLELSYETPVKMLFGSYSFDMQRSIDHPSLNNLQARRHAMLDSRFELTPRFTVGFGGRYDRTDTAGELNYFTGLLLDRRLAERWEAGPSFSYKATPRVTLTGLYNWISESVASSVGGYEQVARLGVTRQTGPRSTFGLSVLGRRFVSADETLVPIEAFATESGGVFTSTDGYALATGGTFLSEAALATWTYQVAPATMLLLQGGPRFTSARDAVVPEIVVSLGRKAPTVVNYGFEYWRGESIILGVLGPVEVNSGTARVAWPIRPNFEVGVHGGMFNSQTLSQGHARVYHTEVVGSWTVKGPLTVAASYGADFQHGDVRSSLLSDKQVIRHVILLRLTAAPRVTRSFQPDDPLQPLGEPSKGAKR
jgi:hypothetical protein